MDDVPVRPSWKELYEQHFAFVWDVVRRLDARQKADVEDLVQEVFIVARKKLPQYDPARAGVRAWLGGIARRVVAGHRRRAPSRCEVAHPMEEIDRMGTVQPDQERVIEARQQEAILDRLLASLDPELAAVVVLHDRHEIGLGEVAVALDVPYTTAEWRLMEGRKRLVAAGARERRRNTFGVLVPIDVASLLASPIPAAPESARRRIWEAMRATSSPPPSRGLSKAARRIGGQLVRQIPGALAGGAAVYALLHADPDPVRSRPPEPAAIVASSSATPATSSESVASMSSVGSLALRAPLTSAAPPAASSAAPSGDDGEYLIRAALTDLAEGRPQGALTWLEQHARDYPAAMPEQRARVRARVLAAIKQP
jgi:RNA polymerase sigma factor (sigma-70 family)